MRLVVFDYDCFLFFSFVLLQPFCPFLLFRESLHDTYSVGVRGNGHLLGYPNGQLGSWELLVNARLHYYCEP
jgi:hypothetical protein